MLRAVADNTLTRSRDCRLGRAGDNWTTASVFGIAVCLGFSACRGDPVGPPLDTAVGGERSDGGTTNGGTTNTETTVAGGTRPIGSLEGGSPSGGTADLSFGGTSSGGASTIGGTSSSSGGTSFGGTTTSSSGGIASDGGSSDATLRGGQGGIGISGASTGSSASGSGGAPAGGTPSGGGGIGGASTSSSSGGSAGAPTGGFTSTLTSGCVDGGPECAALWMTIVDGILLGDSSDTADAAVQGTAMNSNITCDDAGACAAASTRSNASDAGSNDGGPSTVAADGGD